MSKDLKPNATTEAEACEIIELAVEEIELLTKAFSLITDALAGTDPLESEVDEVGAKALLH